MIIKHLTKHWQFYLQLLFALISLAFIGGGVYYSLPAQVASVSSELREFKEQDFKRVERDVQCIKGYLTGRDGMHFSVSYQESEPIN